MKVAAWIRGVRSPSTPHEPEEWHADVCVGEEQPEGEGWVALYGEAAVAKVLNDERNAIILAVKELEGVDVEVAGIRALTAPHEPTRRQIIKLVRSRKHMGGAQ